MASVLVLGVVSVAPAGADPTPAVQQAIVAARGVSSCGPLRYNENVEQAAEIVNRSTYTYLDHTGENVPADEPHPIAIANDLGITATKVASFQGAGHHDAVAIKGLLLQGRDAIPDCSYTDFGVSHLYEPQSDYNLVVAILVGN